MKFHINTHDAFGINPHIVIHDDVDTIAYLYDIGSMWGDLASFCEAFDLDETQVRLAMSKADQRIASKLVGSVA